MAKKIVITEASAKRMEKLIRKLAEEMNNAGILKITVESPSLKMESVPEMAKKAVEKNEEVLAQADRVLAYYREKNPRKARGVKRGDEAHKKIVRRLKEDQIPVEDLLKAVDGNLMCPWHKKTAGGHSLEYVFRNRGKVEKFVEIAEKGVNAGGSDGYHGGSSEFSGSTVDF